MGKRPQDPQEHFAKLIRNTMETEAWRALSTSAQALYPWLKLEWRGPQYNNNGKISLSVGAAAKCLGIRPDAAARAFHDLQAKGFIYVTRPAILGVEGKAAPPQYELTELALPHAERGECRKLFRSWRPGYDWPVVKAVSHNPRGINGRKQNPVTNIVTIPSRKS